MQHNRVIAVILLAFCALFGYFSLNLPKSTWGGELGSSFFPLLILILTAALSAPLCFIKEEKQGEVSEEEAEKKRLEGQSTKEAMGFYALFIVGVALVWIVGFLPGLIISLTAMLVMAGWDLFPKAIVFSCAIVLTVFVLFNTLFRIPLPKGVIF